ncbi:phragmoplastin interacting protein 1-like [Tasmannia lanceolata]|uniref:phragmoplastin interacting protein 1-like n=1 Tax=Tasmannia lanceolata TaxID=3420 RepID=UPI00406396F6
MTSEEEKRVEKKRKKKKGRKDKWGQPLLTCAGEEQPYEDGPITVGNDSAAEEVQSVYEENRIVVSGMPYYVTESEIRGLFEDIGSVSQLNLSRFPDSGNFSGLAFVTFPTEEIARNALKLDGTKMGNRILKVERCRVDPERKRKSEFLDEPKKTSGCLSAYIGNLSWDVTEEDIRECFKASNITSIRFAMNKKTGTFRGFGHIDFADDESLEEAMKKNQVELYGRPMKIAYAVSNRN